MIGSTELIYGPIQRVRGKHEYRPPVSKCGTYGGYQAHYKRGERPCDACMHAQTVYVGQWRARSGRTKNALVPYRVLGALLAAAPSELEEWAEEQLGDAVVTNALAQWHADSARDGFEVPQ